MKKLPIIFQLEEEIFFLFAFLNLTGYDQETNLRGMHWLRTFTRKKLREKLKVERYPLLKYFLSRRHQGQFVQWLLRKKYIPDDLAKIYLKKNLSFVQKFDKEFRKFINNERKNLPLSETKKFYLTEKNNRYPKIVKVLHILMKVLNINFDLLNLKKVIITPNFLDSYNYGYGPKIGKIAFIVYGPLRSGDFRLIEHEFLHSVISPLLSRNKIFLRKLKKISKNIFLKKQLEKKGYDDWAVIIEECFVRAMTIRAQSLNLKEKKLFLEKENKKGFKFIEKIYDRLKNNYEENELIDILNNILNNIEEVL